MATIADAEAIRQIYDLEVETSTVTQDLVPRSLEQQQQYIARRTGTGLGINTIGAARKHHYRPAVPTRRTRVMSDPAPLLAGWAAGHG